MEKLKVLFLCTGHSCRAPMAEAWMNRLAGNIVDVKSAGIEANGISPYTKTVMAEVDIDMSDKESVSLKGDMLEWADLLVTLCDNAEEQCPIVDESIAKLHLPLSDPEKLKDDEDALLAAYRETRDDVKKRVDFVLSHLVDR